MCLHVANEEVKMCAQNRFDECVFEDAIALVPIPMVGARIEPPRQDEVPHGLPCLRRKSDFSAAFLMTDRSAE